MYLVQPTQDHLLSYVAALKTGWSPDSERGPIAAQKQLERIEADPDRFVAGLYDLEARGDPVTLPDGSQVARIPGYHKWMWDDDGFCGSISLRWVPGTHRLPAHVLGHIGYGVVPWKQRLGYATQALSAMLREAKNIGLTYVELTTDPDNTASQRVISVNGGVLVERFKKPPAFNSVDGLRFRIFV